MPYIFYRKATVSNTYKNKQSEKERIMIKGLRKQTNVVNNNSFSSSSIVLHKKSKPHP